MKHATKPLTKLPVKQARRKKKAVAPIPPREQQWWQHVLFWLRSQKLSRPERKLRVCETVSLGDKRFAAVLEYRGQRFLLGGAAQSVQLLTELRGPAFQEALATQQVLASEAK